MENILNDVKNELNKDFNQINFDKVIENCNQIKLLLDKKNLFSFNNRKFNCIDNISYSFLRFLNEEKEIFNTFKFMNQPSLNLAIKNGSFGLHLLNEEKINVIFYGKDTVLKRLDNLNWEYKIYHLKVPRTKTKDCLLSDGLNKISFNEDNIRSVFRSQKIDILLNGNI